MEEVCLIQVRFFSLLSEPYKIPIQVFIVLKPFIICTFWSILAVYIKCWLLYVTSFGIHRKLHGQIFFECIPRQDVSKYWKDFGENKWQATFNSLPFFVIKVSIFLPITQKINIKMLKEWYNILQKVFHPFFILYTPCGSKL